MARNNIFVTAYRLEIFENYDKMDEFIEAISDYAIVSNDEGYVAIIVASSDVLEISKLANMALKFFGKYTLSELGLLGPFKR